MRGRVVDFIIAAQGEKRLHQRGQVFVFVIGNAKMPPKIQSLHPYGGHKTPFQGAQDHAVRQNGNAKAADHSVDQSGCAHGLPDGMDAQPGGFHNALELLAGAAAALPQDEAILCYYTTKMPAEAFSWGAGLEVTMTSRLVMLTACGCLRNSTTK